MKSFKGKPYQLGVKLIELFQNHIGEENSIPRNVMFRKIRGVKFDRTDIKHISAMEDIKHAIRNLRKKSLCFIQSTPNVGAGPSNYYVVKRHKESLEFANSLSKMSKTHQQTIQDGKVSVENKDFRKEWLE